MRDLTTLQTFLGQAAVAETVYALRPDYRALLLAVDGIEPGPSDAATEQLLQQAEESARQSLADRPVEDLPHVAAWREAYRGFGAKPQRTRNSLEALMRRAETGLPRVNRLTDVYNAVSVLHQVPLGGEDLDRYPGRPGWSAPPARNRSTQRRAARPSSSTPTPARSSGATTPASAAAAGTGARPDGPSSPTAQPPPCSSSTPSHRSPTTRSTPPPTTWSRTCAGSGLTFGWRNDC